MFRCVPPYFYVPVTELSYEGEKNIKTLIKSLLFQRNLPNLAILSVYILFSSVYVLVHTNHGKLDNIAGFR